MNNARKTYEVAIYNEAVRECDEKGEKHPNFGKEWAEIHYFEVEALDEAAVRRQIFQRYPERKGFVIKNINEMTEFG